MLRYEFEYLEGGIVSYRYHPEDKREYTGHVKVNAESGEIIEIILSGHPYEHDNYAYAGKLCARIKEFIASGEFKESGIVAWCQRWLAHILGARLPPIKDTAARTGIHSRQPARLRSRRRV